MTRFAGGLLGMVVAATTAALVGATGPVTLTPPEEAAVLKEIEQDRVDARASFETGDAKAGWKSGRDTMLDPSSIRIGRFLIRLSHQRFPGLIVFDPQSPRFRLYKGLRYFPPDLAYRFELP